MTEFPRIEEAQSGKYWDVVYRGYSTPFSDQWDAIRFAASMNLPQHKEAVSLKRDASEGSFQ